MSVLAATASPLAPPAGKPSRAAPTCRHCGAGLLDAAMREAGFCCAGCGYVFRLINEQGFDGYYRIKDDVTTPVDASVFDPGDYEWIEAAQRAVETAPTIPELTVALQGISCAGCVWLIERLFQKEPGARDVIVNAHYGTMRLRWVHGEFSAAAFARKVRGFGYVVSPAGEATAEPESRGLVRRIGLCAAFALNVMLFSLPVYFGMERTFEWAGLFGTLNAAFGTLSVMVGGTYFLGRAARALHARELQIDLPIAIGIVGGYAGSLYGWLAGEDRFVYFDFVSAFIVLMLIGRWAQVAAIERNRRRLLGRAATIARVNLADGSEIAPEKVRAGLALALAPGHTLAVESRLEAAEGSFSLASINGEAEPRVFRAGARVPAGAVNIGRGVLRLVAAQPWSESLLAQLLAPGERAPARHPLIERVVRGYAIGILLIATAAGVGWWRASGDAVRTWAVVTAVLVVSCPCAIALAFPLADEMATVALRRRGVFVRESDLWPRLARVRQVVFDKTGTLTLETPVLKNPGELHKLDATARAALLALVQGNAHPVSQCLLQSLLAAGPVEALAGEVIEEIGQGVSLGPWSLGRSGWRDQEKGEGTMLTRGGAVVARFIFSDAVRPDARAEVDALRARGLEVGILSGDNQTKTSALAAEVGLDGRRAVGELTPQGKGAWLDANDGPRNALMLGDGANDSLAFDHALCRGTPLVHRGVLGGKADFHYLGRGIGGLRALLEVDARRRGTQRVILVFSVAYNLVAVGLAVAGHVNPLVAAVLMPVNSLATLLIVSVGMRPVFRV
ncbi:MAG: heavy metal translocating P-type ATPase metal-binding domain-containing protein [Opitutaceae bacterium]